MLTQADLLVPMLGEPRHPSPLQPGAAGFVPEAARVALEIESLAEGAAGEPRHFEKAGPRERIFFDPRTTRAGIVSCGGLCPGINNVIRSLVLELHHRYGVREVLGFRHGYQGLNPAEGLPPLLLGPAEVRSIHRLGGSILGQSRGRQDVGTMVDALQQREVDILFAIGGDGTMRGAHAIHQEVARRGARISVIGIPKTIDNDISFVDKTFGFETAVEMARLALDAAHTEATAERNGVGIVKLMGRDSGFVAAAATLASAEVNYCLVPEVPFEVEGRCGLLAHLEQRLRRRQHALIAVAEGCGARLMCGKAERDESGNVRYAAAAGSDIGPWLRDLVVAHFEALAMPVHVKYIDPSYMIRSVPANATDSILCDALARHAAHAGMAGKTDIVVGRWHRAFTHVPLVMAAGMSRRIDPALWMAVTETTGQPPLV